MEISIVICTHNPRPKFLTRVLDALRNQDLAKDRWELLLVDNASSDVLSNVWPIDWHPHARHIREEQLGLAWARQRGINEAKAQLLIFVDDDNVLKSDYLSEALRISVNWEQLGVWGGSIVPEFEINPQAHVAPYVGALALREVATPLWSNIVGGANPDPWGAGLCVRLNVAREYVNQAVSSAVRISDRTGQMLLGGGDLEFSRVACRIGLGRGLFPELEVLHLIPKERLEENYLVKIFEGSAISAALLQYKWSHTYPRHPLHPIVFFRFLYKLMLLVRRYPISETLHFRICIAELLALGKARKVLKLLLSPPG